MLTSHFSTSSSPLYPPCLIKDKKAQLKVYLKTKVRMQLEFRRPPVELTSNSFDRMYNLYKSSKGSKPNLLKKEMLIDYPEQYKGEALPVPYTVLVDTADYLKVYQLKRIKKAAKETNRIGVDFWVPSPFAVDTKVFHEKSITFCLNPEHQGATAQHSSGADKYTMLSKHAVLGHNAGSINDLYNWISYRILDYKNNLYKVEYTSYGIMASYISAFQSVADPTKIMYMKHTWLTQLFIPKEKDLQNINLPDPEKTGSVAIDEPLLDGWARLVTLYVQRIKELNVQEKDFVTQNFFKIKMILQQYHLMCKKKKGVG